MEHTTNKSKRILRLSHFMKALQSVSTLANDKKTRQSMATLGEFISSHYFHRELSVPLFYRSWRDIPDYFIQPFSEEIKDRYTTTTISFNIKPLYGTIVHHSHSSLYPPHEVRTPIPKKSGEYSLATLAQDCDGRHFIKTMLGTADSPQEVRNVFNRLNPSHPPEVVFRIDGNYYGHRENRHDVQIRLRNNVLRIGPPPDELGALMYLF